MMTDEEKEKMQDMEHRIMYLIDECSCYKKELEVLRNENRYLKGECEGFSNAIRVLKP